MVFQVYPNAEPSALHENAAAHVPIGNGSGGKGTPPPPDGIASGGAATSGVASPVFVASRSTSLSFAASAVAATERNRLLSRELSASS